MPPTKMSIKALDQHGFEIQIHLQVADLDALSDTVADLVQHGFRPTSGAGDGYMRTPSGEPLCPRHQVPMRLREKQGDSWWSHQVIDPRTGEELYCRGYAGPSSPGWAVPAA